MSHSADIDAPCCADMAVHLDQTCAIHADPWDCPDSAMVTTGTGIGIPVHDGGRSYLVVTYCPWCGTRVTPPGQGTYVKGNERLASLLSDPEIAERVERIEAETYVIPPEVGQGT